MLISISGNMGVGKSTLVEKLSLSLGWEAAFEPVTDNPFLQKAYEDRAAWNFKLQMFYLEQRLRVHQKFQSLPGIYLLDRSVYEGAEVFLPVQLKMGMVTESEFDQYQALFRQALPDLVPPALMVGLSTSTEQLIAQIQKRGRDFELKADHRYFEELQAHYEKWFQTYAYGPKLLLDCRNLNFADSSEDFQKAKSLILAQCEKQN